jgi:hypothetical protein
MYFRCCWESCRPSQSLLFELDLYEGESVVAGVDDVVRDAGPAEAGGANR